MCLSVAVELSSTKTTALEEEHASMKTPRYAGSVYATSFNHQLSNFYVLPNPSRGTPKYMEPEMFTWNTCVSFVSLEGCHICPVYSAPVTENVLNPFVMAAKQT